MILSVLEPLLGHLGNIYPRLTREFYKRLKHDQNAPESMTTVVDGIDLRFTARYIAMALGVRYNHDMPAFLLAIEKMFQCDMALAFMPQLPERQYLRRVNLPEELHFIDWVLVNMCIRHKDEKFHTHLRCLYSFLVEVELNVPKIIFQRCVSL